MRTIRLLLAALVATTAVTWSGAGSAGAASWTLTTAQRQAYLNHYAPLIFKRGDENNGQEGTDWLSNYDFDRNGRFSDNRVNWRNANQYAQGANTHWRIRPTLYSALLEYAENGTKNLVLLYHVYNAADKDFGQIHDWERVEIVLRGVTGNPGTGEGVAYATVTTHHEHIMRRSTDSAVRFMTTPTGKHLMLWQADGSGALPTTTRGHELRFATTPWSTVAAGLNGTGKAEVDINNDSEKNVHYVFVPEASSTAVSTWGARAVTSASAPTLASRLDNGDSTAWRSVKRVTYELQDLADVLPTHWRDWQLHWRDTKTSDVLLETPVTSETGQAEVDAGLQRFRTASLDLGAGDLTDGREGIPSKSWLYGAYSAEANADDSASSDDFGGYEGIGLDSSGRSRGAVSGDPASHGAYWRQHDFFVHTGTVDTADHRESGTWLPAGWHLAANGGFDGRWVQLFDDRP
ncbi:hypothetical protein [Saccharothrix lopnurensis]|uniref:Uncharacterized protein n=1 Tax=Saccharothrix lopnurensis TaxID=1670621 RepID=A0ABW1NXB8_9PSEU